MRRSSTSSGCRGGEPQSFGCERRSWAVGSRVTMSVGGPELEVALRRRRGSGGRPKIFALCRAPGSLSGPRRFGASSYEHGSPGARFIQFWQEGRPPSHRVFLLRLISRSCLSYVRKIIVQFGREILPRTTGGVNACALSSFDGQRLVGGEFDALAFSARFLRGFSCRLLCLLGGRR